MDEKIKDIISNKITKKNTSKKHCDCLNCLINCAEYRLTLQVTQKENNGKNNLFLVVTGKNIVSPLFFYDKSSNEVIELIEKKNISDNFLNESQKIKTENEIIIDYDQKKKTKILLFNHLKFPLININTENNISKQSTILILDNGNHKHDMISNYSVNSFSTYNMNYCLLFDIHNLKNTNNLFCINDIKDCKEIKLKFNSSIHEQTLFEKDEIFYISPQLIISSIKKRMKGYYKYNDPKIRNNLYNKYFFTKLDDSNTNNIGILFTFNKRKNIENIKLNGEYIMNENYMIIKLFICLDMWIDSDNVHETKDTSKSSSQNEFSKQEYIMENKTKNYINYNYNDNYLNNYNENNYTYNNSFTNNNYEKNKFNYAYNNNNYDNNNNNNIYYNNNYYNNNNTTFDNTNYYNINNNNNYYNNINNNRNSNYNKYDSCNGQIDTPGQAPVRGTVLLEPLINSNNINFSLYSKPKRNNYSPKNKFNNFSFDNNKCNDNSSNISTESNYKKPANKLENMEFLEGQTIEEKYELNTLLNNLHNQKIIPDNSDNNSVFSEPLENDEKKITKDNSKSIFIDINQKHIKAIFEKYKQDNCISNYTIIKNKLDIYMNVGKEKLKKIKLKYFFDCFHNINCLTLNIPYFTKKGKLLIKELSPTLSSMRLVLKTKKKTANKIKKQNKNKKNIDVEIINNNIVKIEYKENKPIFLRDLLYTKLDEINPIIEDNKLTFNDILIDKSNFVILWTFTDSNTFNSSFLAYYSLDLKLIGFFINKFNYEECFSSFSYDIDNYKDYKEEYNKNKQHIKEMLKHLTFDKEDGYNKKYSTPDYINYLEKNNE
jgi:hypothetical protein